MKIENRLLNVSTVLQNQSKLQGKLQYAYYLLYNKEKIDEITYQYENKASFNINPSMNLGRVIVVSFVRDKFGNKVRSSSRLK